MTSMNVKRHDGYIKSLLTSEMVEVVTELNAIIIAGIFVDPTA